MPTRKIQLEEAQQQHRLDRFLSQLDRAELLICDELGYLSFSRTGAELLFQVFADRYERRSLLLTSNLAFGEWGHAANVIGCRTWPADSGCEPLMRVVVARGRRTTGPSRGRGHPAR